MQGVVGGRLRYLKVLIHADPSFTNDETEQETSNNTCKAKIRRCEMRQNRNDNFVLQNVQCQRQSASVHTRSAIHSFKVTTPRRPVRRPVAGL